MAGPVETFFAPCPRGLEDLLCDEVRLLGAEDIAVVPGGVGFTGSFDLCYRVNLESRIASRVLWRVWSGLYRREQDLYDAAIALAWPDWFSVQSTIKVKVSARHCPLKSLDFITLRIKDAVCDRFTAVRGRRPTVDTRKPSIRIDAYLDHQTVLFYLDTSGEPLFKRGLRRVNVEAPLRENLAAGILRLSGWHAARTLLDPMCGSGTIVMEAAQMGSNMAPGLGRSFAFEQLHGFDARQWERLCEERRARQTTGESLPIYACDRSEKAVHATRANLQAAGLDRAVHVKRADVLDMIPPTDEGILVTNPPYGVRMGMDLGLAKFYPLLGDALKQRFTGWHAYLLSVDLNLPKHIGLAATRRTPLFNGALECRLFEFKIVRGVMRRTKTKVGA
ncbi:MAG TPA: THUMP domain-containing protein [Nitrospiraceae bacterium]|nr:THUMP domain-containing protein [Nitrospiraceae bacterium]